MAEFLLFHYIIIIIIVMNQASAHTLWTIRTPLQRKIAMLFDIIISCMYSIHFGMVVRVFDIKSVKERWRPF